MTKKRQSGHSVIELALMAPWIFFLFMGVLDVGFYMYAAINTENAARVAVMYTSSSVGAAALGAGTAGGGPACTYVLKELGSFPFPGGKPNVCTSLPLQVTVSTIASLDGEAAPTQASSVSVSVQTLPMIPIPGLMGQLTITRTAQARINNP